MAHLFKAKAKLSDLFKEALNNNNFNHFKSNCKSLLLTICEGELKNTIELMVREVLLEFIMIDAEIILLERIFHFSIEAALYDIAPGNLPVLVLGDMFESSTLVQCEKIFKFVENRVDIFKKDFFFKHCKNHLLRSCNDLLRRLSRSQNTVFCGRILVFLAHIFPLSERSGLNIISEFNLENTTVYDTSDDVFADFSSDKGEGTEEGEIPNINLNQLVANKKLYQKFWSLQEYFRNPNTCYNKLHWRHFADCSTDILTAFSNFKSDDANLSKWKQAEMPSASGESVYFAKYLTSPKLLELELSDSNFRRYLLVQFLILFQYLSSTVKFKLETFVLTEEQQSWIKEATMKIYKLLEETPPNGDAFCSNVKKILQREEYWNSWKNEGCPDFKHIEEKIDWKEKSRKRPGDDSLLPPSKIQVGSPELTKLWNICPDNWEACRSPKRNFVPSMENYFGIRKFESGYTNQKRDLNDPKFSWKALRLLSMKSPHFFTVSTAPPKSLPEYLESMIQKHAKEKPHSPQEIVCLETEHAGAGDDDNDELLHTSEEETKEEEKIKKVNQFMQSQIEIIAEKIQNNWQVLASHLGFQEDEIEYFQQKYSNSKNQAENMLIVWSEQEPDDDNLLILKKALENSGLLNLWSLISVNDN